MPTCNDKRFREGVRSPTRKRMTSGEQDGKIQEEAIDDDSGRWEAIKDDGRRSRSSTVMAQGEERLASSNRDRISVT